MIKKKDAWRQEFESEKRVELLLSINNARMSGAELVTKEDLKLLSNYWDVLDGTLPPSHASDLFKEIKKNKILNGDIIFENIMQSSNFELFHDYFKYFNQGISFNEPREAFWNDERSSMINALSWWYDKKNYEGIYSIFSQVCPHLPQSTLTMCSLNPENINETSWLSLALIQNDILSIETLYPLEVPDISTPEGVEKRAQLLVNLLQDETPFFVFEKNKEYVEDILQPEVLQQFLTLTPELIFEMESNHTQRRMTDMMNVLLSALSIDTPETTDEAIKKTIINSLPAMKDKNDLKYRVIEVLLHRMSKGPVFSDPELEEKLYSMVSVKTYGIDREFRDLLTASTHLFLQGSHHVIQDKKILENFLKQVPHWISDTSTSVVKKLFTSSLISNFMSFTTFDIRHPKELSPMFEALKDAINIRTVFESGNIVIKKIKDAIDEPEKKEKFSESFSEKIRKIDHSLYAMIVLKPLFKDVLSKSEMDIFNNYYDTVFKAWKGLPESWKNNLNDSEELKKAQMFFKELVVNLELLHKVNIKPKVALPAHRF